MYIQSKLISPLFSYQSPNVYHFYYFAKEVMNRITAEYISQMLTTDYKVATEVETDTSMFCGCLRLHMQELKMVL